MYGPGAFESSRNNGASACHLNMHILEVTYRRQRTVNCIMSRNERAPVTWLLVGWDCGAVHFPFTDNRVLYAEHRKKQIQGFVLRICGFSPGWWKEGPWYLLCEVGTANCNVLT
jgi:hypothetical protein